MKRNFTPQGFILLALACIIIVMASCSKENVQPTTTTNAVVTASVKDMLTAGTWKNTNTYTLNADGSVKSTNGSANFSVTFKADGTYTSSNGSGTWTLIDDTHIAINEPGATTNKGSFIIATITATEFVYITPILDKYTFTH